MLITFEGVEGSGKTTQVRILQDYLKLKARDVVATREPGGTPLADRLRRMLLNPENAGMTPLTELFLYLAARAQHVDECIRPALDEGKWVLCDRYVDATLAYQGGGRKLSFELVRQLNTAAIQGTRPHLTFLIDLPAELGLKRARERYHAKEGTAKGDRIEQETIAFHERVRDVYLELARQEPTRIRVVDGTMDIDAIHQRIVQELEPFLTP